MQMKICDKNYLRIQTKFIAEVSDDSETILTRISTEATVADFM